METTNEMYNALAEEYYTRYPNLVTDIEAGRIYASFEICGMSERTETGIVNIHYDSISYMDNEDSDAFIQSHIDALYEKIKTVILRYATRLVPRNFQKRNGTNC